MKPKPTINFRGWLAVWLQKRSRARQHRLLPGPVLSVVYPDQVVWEWNYPDPYRWNAYLSLDGGATWQFDDWKSGDARSYSPDGGSTPMLIVGVDASGGEITMRSNSVRTDDAVAPLAAPVLVDAGYAWNNEDPPAADIDITFTFEHGPYPPASVELWVNREGYGYENLITVDSLSGSFFYPNATETLSAFDFKARYVNGSVVGPFSNVLHLDIGPS